MYQNTPVTPQMAELGAAIIAAVHAVLADPDAASAAVAAHAEAQKLSADQLFQLEADKAFMAQAAEERKNLEQMESELLEQKQVLDATQAKLTKAYDVHTANVEALSSSVKLHADDLKNHEQDKKQLKAMKDAFASEYSQFLDKQEENRNWEKDLLRREQAITGAAAQIANNRKAVG